MADERLRERVARHLADVLVRVRGGPSLTDAEWQECLDGSRTARVGRSPMVVLLARADAVIATCEAWQGEQRLKAHELTFNPRWSIEMFGRDRGGRDRGDEDEAAP